MKASQSLMSEFAKRSKNSKQKSNQKNGRRRVTDDETTGSADALEHLPTINKGEGLPTSTPGSDRKMLRRGV